nr:type II secretion system protein [Geotalea sp. SG265]
MATSLNNDNGFTLIEVMIAIIIMMVGLLGLLQSINVATEYNLKNHLRDEAVYVGEKYLNELKGRGFDNIPSYLVISTASKIRGINKKLMVETNSSDISTDSYGKPLTKRLNVIVRWTYKGVTYDNRLSAPVSKIPN